MSNKKQNETRTRNWTVVVYPDSAPANWRDIIDSWHIEWIESPLHDMDMNADGEPKKAHWHILLCFSSVKSYEQVLALCQELNCPIPKQVHNSKSLVRYMAHIDNPEKHQYKIADIISHGGIDIADMLRPSSSEKYTYIREMQRWCREYGIVEFQDLMDYAAEFRFDDWYPLLCDKCTFVMKSYLSSKRYRNTVAESDHKHIDIDTGKVIDDNTGEVIG